MSGRCGWIQGVKMPCKTLGWMGRAARLWLSPVLPLLPHQAARCRAPSPQLHPLVLAALLGGRGDGASAVLELQRGNNPSANAFWFTGVVPCQ